MRAIVDDELVGVGEAAAFVDAFVENAGPLETVPRAYARVDVFVCLAERAVCRAAVDGIYGCVLAWCTELMDESALVLKKWQSAVSAAFEK